MKRSPLTRKTPLKRGTSTLKRTPLKRISKDERKRISKRRGPRDKYKREHPVCQCERDCGGEACELHEIAAGQQHKWKSAELPSCWLHLTERCHDRLQGVNYVIQLGAKLYHDPEHYDHHEFHRVIGRKPTAHAIEDVIAAMPRKPKESDDCLLTLQHWQRKRLSLERLLAEAKEREREAQREYNKAQSRSTAIAAARKE